MGPARSRKMSRISSLIDPNPLIRLNGYFNRTKPFTIKRFMVFEIGLKNFNLKGGDGNGPRLLLRLGLMIVGILVIAGIGFGLRHAWSKLNTVQPQPQPPPPAAAQPQAQAVAPAPTASPQSDEDLKRVTQIRALMAAKDKDWATLRAKSYEALAQIKAAALLAEIEQILGAVNMELLFLPAPMPEKEDYVVQSGDSLDKLSKRYKTTVELIEKSNQLKGRMLRPGDRLRIFKASLTIDVSKTRNDLLLLANNRFFKRYRVGSGKYGSTPTGTFVVTDRIAEPPWWRPDGKIVPFGDKENVLGTRWLALNATGDTPKVRGYGIHGTWEPDSIGKQSSAGCVRLVNTDVEELFSLVPMGTPVTITE